MADIKKNQNRDELFRTIYKIATDLVHAGHVSEWDFKSYVLGTMFYRYISENFAAYINVGEHAAGNTDFDYAKMSDEEAESAREGLVQEKGFFILPSELFCNVRARADKDENLNETNCICTSKSAAPKPRTAVAIHTRGKCSSPLAEMTFTNPTLDAPTVTILKHLDISRCKDTARIKRSLS